MITLTIRGDAAAAVGKRTLPVEGRTRGPIAPPAAEAEGLGGPRTLPFVKLLGDLREQIRYMPLTVIIHGWGGREVEYFFETMVPALGDDDAVWLV
ncbi:MAG: hypothetical protein WCD76_15565, partial [Pyrinomonadaceae bacterium]